LEELDDLLILKKLSIRISSHSIFRSPLLKDSLVGYDDSDNIVLKRITIHEYLLHIAWLSDLVFNLIRCDVLSLRELEDILLAIDDL
jgi:hypothetical protein